MDREYELKASDTCCFLYDYVRKDALLHDRQNTLKALDLLKELLDQERVSQSKLEHSLMVCRMMIDLNMGMQPEEMDVMFAAAMCHILPEEHVCAKTDDLLVCRCSMDPEVCEIVALLYQLETASESELSECYEQIQKNKIAALITIADRGNMVEQLYGMNSWQVRRFIYETRTYYLPICIYAKEHYNELLSPLGILMEKMRNLTDVSEILMVRFEERETELVHEILALREENATIRGILQKLKQEQRQ